MTRQGIGVLGLLLAFPASVTACSHYVPLIPDSKWHTVVSIQVPDKSEVLRLKTVKARRSECQGNRVPLRTEVRVVLVESFQNLQALPERLEDAKPREDGIPIKIADSGPYDLTLIGARRLISLSTGKQLLARTDDECAALTISKIKFAKSE